MLIDLQHWLTKEPWLQYFKKCHSSHLHWQHRKWNKMQLFYDLKLHHNLASINLCPGLARINNKGFCLMGMPYHICILLLFLLHLRPLLLHFLFQTKRLFRSKVQLNIWSLYLCNSILQTIYKVLKWYYRMLHCKLMRLWQVDQLWALF